MGLLDNTTAVQYYETGDYGNYQFTSLEDVINQFQIAYVGEDKIISKIKRADVAFHAQRAMQELSFDTFKSCKAQEITVPASLQMILPQDYVNYTKISWVDSAGIKHLMYPTSKTSNPIHYYQNEEGINIINPVGTLILGSNIVVLDGDYSGILVHGMRVEGPNLRPASHIHNITTTAGITSITLENKNGNNDKDALLTTNEELLITRFNYLTATGFFTGHDIRLANQTLVETTATADTVIGDTQVNVASVDGIEVGMLVNQHAFVNNNDVDGGNGAIKVIGVGTSTVELSHPSAEVILSGEAKLQNLYY